MLTGPPPKFHGTRDILHLRRANRETVLRIGAKVDLRRLIDICLTEKVEVIDASVAMTV
jgi:hypothetical protein